MTPEHLEIPACARRECQADLGWMRIDRIRAENLDAFSAIASVAFENTGRGAIVVDTTSQAMPGAASEGTPNHTSEPAAEPELKPPDVETLIATEQIFSGYGLAVRPGSNELLAGLLMVDRPRPADPEWLTEVEATFGEYYLVSMTPAGERGIACQMQIEPDNLPHLRRFPGEKTAAIQRVLKLLLSRAVVVVTCGCFWRRRQTGGRCAPLARVCWPHTKCRELNCTRNRTRSQMAQAP